MSVTPHAQQGLRRKVSLCRMFHLLETPGACVRVSRLAESEKHRASTEVVGMLVASMPDLCWMDLAAQDCIALYLPRQRPKFLDSQPPLYIALQKSIQIHFALESMSRITFIDEN